MRSLVIAQDHQLEINCFFFPGSQWTLFKTSKGVSLEIISLVAGVGVGVCLWGGG